MISFYKSYFGPDFSARNTDLKELTKGDIIRINGSRELYKIISVEFVGREYSWPGFDYIFKTLVCVCKFRDIKVDGLNLDKS